MGFLGFWGLGFRVSCLRELGELGDYCGLRSLSKVHSNLRLAMPWGFPQPVLRASLRTAGRSGRAGMGGGGVTESTLLGFRVWGWGLGFGVWGLGLLGFLGFRFLELGFRAFRALRV